MKQLKYFIVILSILCFVPMGKAQSDFQPNGSFNIELGFSKGVSDKAFRELVQGLATVTPSYQYTFDNSFSVGGGLRYSLFNVNEFKNNIDMSGGLHILGVFAKVGQEKFYGKFGLDYGVRLGYTMNLFATNKNKEKLGRPYYNDGIFVEPTIGFALMANEKSAFRLAIGYAFHPTFKFQPEQMGVDQFSGFSSSDIDKFTQYFTIGFGYSFYFGQE